MGKQANRKLRERQKLVMKQARLVERVFSTDDGKELWALLMPYYEQKISPGGPAGQTDFQCGQRDVIGWLYQMRRMARQGAPELGLPLEDAEDISQTEEVTDAAVE